MTHDKEKKTPPCNRFLLGLCKINKAMLAVATKIPLSAVSFIARFSLAAVFWLSGQTKIEGFAANFITGNWEIGLPRLSDSTVFLFEAEYALPLISPLLAAYTATLLENIGALFLLFGFATRWTALAFLGMTLTIQIFVYPGAYAMHGTWAAVLLYLLVYGPGKISIDHWIAKKCA